MQINVTTKVNESLNKKLDEVRIKTALEKAVRQTALDLQKASMKECPVDTGNLRRSHSYEVRMSGSMIEALLKNSANYWQYVNFGTSKMDANDFMTRAFESVAPARATAQYFDQFYGGGG